jgi:holin-like protein
VANGLTQHLGLLFVPAAVGVIVFLPQLAEYGVELMLALSLSVAASMATTALVLKRRERAGRDR